MRAIDLIARARTRFGRRVRRLRRTIADRAQNLRARAESRLHEWRGVDSPTEDAAQRARREREARIDEAGEESFPASDPPSWTSRGTC